MSCNPRRSPITHPDATSFLRVSREGVFQHPRLFSTVFIPSLIIKKTFFFVAVCFVLETQGQNQASIKAPFAGCYKIVSQRWHPMNEDAVPIPQRFQLRNDAADERHDSRFFAMRSFPANSNAWDKLWVWRPRGSRLWISWGTGLGGFRGSLKQSQPGEFVGKIKEWCDSRCEWKRRVATIRIQKTDCTE